MAHIFAADRAGPRMLPGVMARLSSAQRKGLLFLAGAFVINLVFAALTGHPLGVERPRDTKDPA